MIKRVTLLLGFLLTACQPATPPSPITAVIDEEFTLAPGQTVAITDADLTLTLESVPDDGRCPLDIECAESGPVTVIVMVRSSLSEPTEIIFRTFTDNDGRVPEMEFEGMKTRIEHNGDEVILKSILPFPQNRIGEVKAEDYRVGFVVTKVEN